MRQNHPKPCVIQHGPHFPEPVQVIATLPIKFYARYLKTIHSHKPILSVVHLTRFHAPSKKEPFNGAPRKTCSGSAIFRAAVTGTQPCG